MESGRFTTNPTEIRQAITLTEKIISLFYEKGRNLWIFAGRPFIRFRIYSSTPVSTSSVPTGFSIGTLLRVPILFKPPEIGFQISQITCNSAIYTVKNCDSKFRQLKTYLVLIWSLINVNQLPQWYAPWLRPLVVHSMSLLSTQASGQVHRL